jgi:predicted ester cyclase
MLSARNFPEADEMSAEANKSLVRRYYDEVLNGRDLGILDEIAVADYDEHSPFPGQPNGLEGLKARAGALLAAFEPYVFTLQHVVAEGDLVVVRWMNTATHSGSFMGIPPTGRVMTISGIDVHKVRDGKMAEHWHVVEELQMMQQLGLIPTPSAAPA